MSRCEEIRNYHNTTLQKMKKAKEKVRIHLAEIKELSQTANQQ